MRPTLSAPHRRGLGLSLVALGWTSIAPDHLEAQSRVMVKGFAEVGFSASTADGVPSSFELGQYDNYVTGVLSNKVDFLSEAVVEYDDGWIVDLERFWVRYALTSDLTVSAGKFHTPIGYWNRAYHHGALLQPSLERPLAFAFDDEGGQLPIHTTGVLVSGANLGSAEVGFDLMLGNGIGSSTAGDNDEAKSLSARISARPADVLSVGVSAYRDRISAGIERPNQATTTASDLDQTILGADARIRSGSAHLLSEVVWSMTSDGTSYDSWGYYVLAAFDMSERLAPYLKLDEFRVAPNDPYYGGPDTRVFAVGARYSLGLLAAVKAEVRRTEYSSAGADDTALLLRMNIGW